jgi:hypothetical protein
MIQKDPLIGLHVRYFDYLDMERFGTVIMSEPYPNDESVRYVYIEDDDPEYNIHQDVVLGQTILYAEIRLSTEVNVDEQR